MSPSKDEIRKRRVAETKQADRIAAASAKATRRRRLMVGGVGGLLVVAMIVTLAAGLFAGGVDDSTTTTVTTPDGAILVDPDEVDIPDLDLEELPDPPFIAPAPAGESITGPTLCPATDGSQARTTSFEEAPPVCIDEALLYDIVFSTTLGEFTVEIDPTLDPAAANVFVTLSRYGTYNGSPFSIVADPGFVVSGEPGAIDAGFVVEGSGPSDPDSYQIGTVAMFTFTDGSIGSRFAIVVEQAGAEVLATDPAHPVIGTVSANLETLKLIVEEAGSPAGIPFADVRITDVAVTERSR